MNNNVLTQQTLAYLSVNFQIVKFEVLNVEHSSQNIGTHDFRIQVLAGQRIIQADFDYHSKLKSITLLLSLHECEYSKMQISPMTILALGRITTHFNYAGNDQGETTNA